ncbi:MAG: hypothetical protein J2P36_07545, partial [Ktedonobacteraceae bacterium]|nr:hypothetical protein [Ktedonobacteraceae bacterium]
MSIARNGCSPNNLLLVSSARRVSGVGGLDKKRKNNMLLNDIELTVRQDLFDPGATRWTNSDIARAIDAAIDEYSQHYPCIAIADMSTRPYQRTYPYPQSWNPAYPILWIEKILYPLQIPGSAIAAPQTAPQAVPVAGTGLAIGTYKYLVTYITPGGETPAGPSSIAVSTTSGSQWISLSDIPIGPSSSQPSNPAASAIIGRNLYRTQTGGSIFYLLASIPDNSGTTFLDSIPDSELNGMPQPPQVNTSGIMLWPPSECPFAEYSSMYNAS